MKQILVVLVLLVACLGTSMAQTPVTLQLGPTAGVNLPSGDFSNAASTGWVAGAEGRFGGILPFGGLTASVLYSQMATNPSSDYKWSQFQVNVGAEYAIPAEGVKPYLGVDLIMTSLSVNVPGASSATREGLGFGGGVLFMDNLDANVKYQMINLVGKEAGEGTYGQIQVKLAYLFNAM